MKALLDRIIEARYEADSFYYDHPFRPRPGRPASLADLQRLDAFLAMRGFVTPKAYRAFLSIYNGIEGILGLRYSLLSIDDIVTSRYPVMEEIAAEFPNVSQFVIGGGDTPNILGFDVSTASVDPGYEVVEISDTGDEWRCANFEEFLSRLLANLEGNILAQQRDRQNLPP